ncbi:hypothetical protein MHYP_G00186610 [Metynnis hypsauchen]
MCQTWAVKVQRKAMNQDGMQVFPRTGRDLTYQRNRVTDVAPGDAYGRRPPIEFQHLSGREKGTATSPLPKDPQEAQS